MRAAHLAAPLLATLAAGCMGDDNDMMDGSGMGNGGMMNPACATDDECESLGPGNMCMGGMCMAMDVAGPTVMIPPPSEQDTIIPLLTDTNPDPAIFEADLEVRVAQVDLEPRHPVNVYAYADVHGFASIPGPMVDVVEGTHVIIHVHNALEEPTSIHWHGLELPVEMDGVPDMPTPPIAAGGDFTYEFDASNPALYWFHPHVRSDVQVERGLYAPFVIRPATPQVSAERERVLVLDDVLLDGSGNIEPADTGSAHLTDPTSGEISMTFVGMMGRQGNRLLLNGRMNPILHARAGAVERWRLVNSANARFFNIVVPGATILRIGGDSGLAEQPTEVDHVLLAPGQRADLLVRFDGAPGSQLSLLTRHYNRGHDLADPGDLQMAQISLDDPGGSAAGDFPAVHPDPIPAAREGSVVHRIEMSEVELRGGRVGFALNGELWPNVTPAMGTLGVDQTWEVVNMTHMDHPFHLHGTRFQVTSRGMMMMGTSPVTTPREWTDTVDIPAMSTARFVTRFDRFPGSWMYHCHIFEHAESGMMGMLEIE